VLRDADVAESGQDRHSGPGGDQRDRDAFCYQFTDRLFGRFTNRMVGFQKGTIHVEEYSFVHFGVLRQKIELTPGSPLGNQA